MASPNSKSNQLPFYDNKQKYDTQNGLNNVTKEKLENSSYSKKSTRSPQMTDFFGEFNKKNDQHPFGFVSIKNAMKLTQKIAGGLLGNSKNLKKN